MAFQEQEPTYRPVVPEAEKILGREYKVLDHGFVRLVDYMGGDAAIVQAARVSYGKGTKQVSEDRGLIRYLMRHRHTTPFEMVELKFHAKLPIFVARQWIRHRTASVNEYSGRYSVMKPEFYNPEQEQVRLQSQTNKQGRDEAAPDDVVEGYRDYQDTHDKEAYAQYEQFVDQGIAKELARISLPLSLYTEWYWKIDLHNLFHFLGLRMDAHAQWEFQQYANVMAMMTQAVAPIAYEAFMDYRVHATSVSGPESRIMGALLEDPHKIVTLDTLVEEGLSKREAGELLDKLKRVAPGRFD